jgi:hypothetical protein
MKSLVIAAPLAFALCMGPINHASAQGARTGLDIALNDVTCEQADMRVATSLVRERLIVAAGLAFDRDIFNALEGNSLGALAATRTSGPLFELLKRVSALMDPNAPLLIGANPRFSLKTTSNLSPRDKAIEFLNGQTDDVLITCVMASTPLQPVPVPAPGKRNFIVADSKNDLIKVPRDRAFATIGFEDDRITDTNLFNMSIALAREPMRLAMLNPRSQISWTPFLQYNRRTAPAGREQVNDLTLGSSFIVRNPLRVGGVVGFASLAYQTDDQTRAQVWIGDALVDFPRLGICTRKDILGWDMRCNVSLVLDYADVNDPGASRRLASLDRYFRVGPNISMVAEQRFPIGMISMNMSYFGRYDTLSGEATGDLFSIGTGFRPSPSSNFSLQTSYTVGTTLNTLVDVDKVSVRIGYRM